MPGFDKTGPNGQGSATGWGIGNCQTEGLTGSGARGGRDGGMRRGFGRQGAGRQDFGRRCAGMRMRSRFFAQNNAQVDPAANEGLDELYNMVEALRGQVEDLTNRLVKAVPEIKRNSEPSSENR